MKLGAGMLQLLCLDDYTVGYLVAQSVPNKGNNGAVSESGPFTLNQPQILLVYSEPALRRGHPYIPGEGVRLSNGSSSDIHFDVATELYFKINHF